MRLSVSASAWTKAFVNGTPGRSSARGLIQTLATTLLATLLTTGMLTGCGERSSPPAAQSGDAERGRLLLRQYGCGNCHRIPGVAAASGHVGPPLEGVGRRVYLAGFLPNNPANMAAWIRSPQVFAPRTAMPDMQVGESDARHMVAYLQRLR